MAGVDGAERALELGRRGVRRHATSTAAVAHLSAAIRGFTAAGDSCRAAMACVRLGDVLANVMGNLTAGRAWFARARRLVEDEPPCVEQGWVAVAAMGCDVDDPAELLAAAELALDRARRFGDVNLETKALADAGLAHVQAGRRGRGHGAARRGDGAGLRAGRRRRRRRPSRCARSSPPATTPADFERAGSWADLLAPARPDRPRPPGRPVFLSGHCDSVQATLLVELGRWSEAEAVLAARPGRLRGGDARRRAGTPTSRWPTCASARAGWPRPRRCCSARTSRMQALLPAARLHLARGDHDLARATARRGLRAIGDDRLRAVELLAVLVDAELGRRRPRGGRRRRAPSSTRAPPTLDVAGAAAPRRRAPARGSLAAAGDVDRRGRRRCEAAVDELDAGQLPWLRATLLRRAGPRSASGPATAPAPTLDAQAAAAALADARRRAGAGRRRAARPAGRGAPATPPAPRRRRWRCDGEWWIAACDGTSVRLPRHARACATWPSWSPSPASSATCSTSSTGSRASRRRRARPAGARRRRRAARRRGPGGLPAPHRGSCGPRPTTRSPPGMLEAAEAIQAELDQLVAELARGVRARRPRPAGGVGGRAGPPQRHPGAAGGDRQAGRGAARRRRRARPAGPHRPLLRLRARGRRRRALDRSVLTERDRPRTERLRGMEHHATDRRRDRRRDLPHLDLGPRGEPRRLHLQPVPGRRRRAAAVPHRAARACSRSSPRRWPRWCRSSRCAGSPSATSSPTSAASMNMWLAAAPDSQVAHGALGCDVSLNDLCDRPPRALAEGEVHRPRRQAGAPDLDAARAPRLGGPGAVRGDDRHAAVRRPVHPGRRAARR